MVTFDLFFFPCSHVGSNHGKVTTQLVNARVTGHSVMAEERVKSVPRLLTPAWLLGLFDVPFFGTDGEVLGG